MDFDAVREREKEVIAVWKPRNEARPPRIPCYDCTSDFLYEQEPNLTVHHIRDGVYGWDEPDKLIALCSMHHSIRKAGEEKYSLARLDRLQIAVGHWGKATFPNATTDSILAHLAEEVIELLGSEKIEGSLARMRTREGNIWRIYPPAENLAEESADILLMLLHLAEREDYDLMEATLKKFDEVQDAEWYDAGGYMKRVKK